MNGILFYSTLFVVFLKRALQACPPSLFLSLYNNTFVSFFYIIYFILPTYIIRFLYAASPPALPFLHFGHVLCTVCTVRR
jgi:hypothetical protein